MVKIKTSFEFVKWRSCSLSRLPVPLSPNVFQDPAFLHLEQSVVKEIGKLRTLPKSKTKLSSARIDDLERLDPWIRVVKWSIIAKFIP
jgi:hypothetical protein